MNREIIYVLYTCDRWKSRDSMRLLCVSSSFEKIKAMVRKNIKIENMYFDNLQDSSEEQLTKFDEFDWTMHGNTEINDRLTYGYFDYVYDGEEI